MLKNLFVTALAAALALAAGYAEQSNSHVVVQIPRTTPIDGKQMFLSYCAPCHGADGRGHGPVAIALKRQPIDLTVLTRNNGGRFPALHIVSVLQYGSEIPSHGSAQMPVWGPLFGTMNQSAPSERELRITNLSQYLKTIQVK